VQEVQAKQTIQALKAEIANLSRLAESGAAMSLAEDATLAELMKQKEELLRERDVQVGGTCQQGRQGAMVVFLLKEQIPSRQQYLVTELQRLKLHLFDYEGIELCDQGSCDHAAQQPLSWKPEKTCNSSNIRGP
jgi:hypothetical protein